MEMLLSPTSWKALMLAFDHYGIYAQRRSLQRAGVELDVWRDREWWHA